ncbi:MAG: hypothetical protein K2L28_04665 [Muribaculaceae bacterium]|nr:hypothetical protein [Muribaculaceae bacterium]
MKKEHKDYTKKSSRNSAQKQYPGAAIDRADDKKVDSELVKERTRTLNCNPRNNSTSE